MPTDCLTSLLGIQGFRVVRMEWQKMGKEHSAAMIHLERNKGVYRCGECGQAAPGYDHHWQEVQHLTLWQHLSFLRFERYRVNCPTCGIRTEALDFVDIRGPQVTRPLSRLISELCKVMTNKAVGILQGLHRHTIKDIDKGAMAKVQAERSLDGLSVLCADEIAVGKGQNYWTMLGAPEGPRGPELLYIVEGAKRNTSRNSGIGLAKNGPC